MRTLLFAIALACPAFTQGQQLVVQVDHTLTGGQYPNPAQAAPFTFQRPNLPGQIHTVIWDLQVTVTGSMTVTNMQQVPGTLDGFYTAHCFREWYSDPMGSLAGNIQSDVLQPGESAVVDASTSAHIGAWAPIYFAGRVPDSLSLDFWIYEEAPFGQWSFCPEGSTGCTQFSYDGQQVAFNPDFQIHFSGTLTWVWTPDMVGTIDICPGDGIQRIGLHGDWNDQVTAYSTWVGNYTMLFMGDYHATPNSSFCIGSGQRISASLRQGMILLDWMDEFVVMGQTYTLQAVHRHGIGEVRFSNAVLFSVF